MHSIYLSAQRRREELFSYGKAAIIGRSPSQRFLIFAQGRTGTWLLTHFLNSHPEIACEKEILMFPKYAPQRYMTARSRLSGGKVYGCHVQVNQLLTAQKADVKEFLSELVDEGWQIIYLRRADIVRQSISTILATRRRQWYTYDLTEIDTRPQIIEPNELHRWLQRRIDHHKIERDALHDLSHLSLTYEDDLRDAVNHQATMDRVFNFLDLPTIPVIAETKRLSGELRDTIANYEELMAAICNTPIASYTNLC